MNKRESIETPPALPPKLYKLRRKEPQINSTCRSPLPAKNHKSSRRTTVQSSQSGDLDNGLSNILSLTSSDLKGKPRDELVLMLLHLNHEKANLLRWKDYFNEQIGNLASVAETDPKAGEEIDNLCLELKEVESQLKACTPIITFLNKKLRMNDVCGGSDSTQDSPVYEKPNVSLARQKSINFLRREEEREVARALKAEMRGNSMELGEIYGVVTTSQMLERRRRQPSVESPRGIRLKDYPEEPAFRKRRLQLESELKKLNELWKEACEYAPTASPSASRTVSTSCRRQKSSVLRRVESRKIDSSSSEVARSRSACDVNSLAYVPRRSTRGLHRSDLVSSFSADLERRPTRSQSQSALPRNQEGTKSPLRPSINRSVSSASIGRPLVNQKQGRFSENSKIYTTVKTITQAATAAFSPFLMEPTQAVQSRWKVSTDEGDGSSSNSAFSSPPPPPLPPPPIPGPRRRKSSSSAKSPPQLNRWRSFGDNLWLVDPQLKPKIGSNETSENSQNYQHRNKSPASDSSQSTLNDRPGDFTPVPSEDPYEKTPLVDSQYLSPRNLNSSSSTRVNRRNYEEEQPLNKSSLTTAVEYVPSELNYETTESSATTISTYPPKLTEEPFNKIALALPKHVYPPFDEQTGNEKKTLTLPISMFSAFRTPEKSFGLHQTQSAI